MNKKSMEEFVKENGTYDEKDEVNRLCWTKNN